MTVAVTYIIGEYLRQARFSDCLLAIDKIGVDLTFSEFSESSSSLNLAQQAILDSCRDLIKQQDDLGSNVMNMLRNMMTGEGQDNK